MQERLQHHFSFKGVNYVIDDVPGHFHIELPTGETLAVGMWLESYPPQIGNVVQVDHNPTVTVVKAIEAPRT